MHYAKGSGKKQMTSVTCISNFEKAVLVDLNKLRIYNYAALQHQLNRAAPAKIAVDVVIPVDIALSQ